MSYEVQKQALEHDATIWDDTSTELGRAGSSARAISVTTNAVSIVGSGAGLEASYTATRDVVADLLDQGSTATDTMAHTLRRVRRQYDADDEAAMRLIGDQWTPVE